MKRIIVTTIIVAVILGALYTLIKRNYERNEVKKTELSRRLEANIGDSILGDNLIPQEVKDEYRYLKTEATTEAQ